MASLRHLLSDGHGIDHLENHSLESFFLVQRSPINSELKSELELLGITLREDLPSQSPYLIFENERLTLRLPSGLEMHLDFTDLKYQRRFKPSSELLCRACGWHLGLRDLWDLTAGLGGDAVLLAQAGFHVRAIERNKYLVLLLREAHRKLQGLPNLSFAYADSESLLSSGEPRPEVLYYDPMYPAKRKTALPSKEMQILRELIGKSGESVELLEKALTVASKRVVVKRPLSAPPIIAKPTAESRGKLVRYDIYLTK